MSIGVWINISVFDLIPLIYLSVFMPILSCFYYYTSVVEHEIRDNDTSGSSFIVQDCFRYPGFFFSNEGEYCSFKIFQNLEF